MGNLFTIDDGTRRTITLALDDIITEFGKDCRLVYPAAWQPCVNCVYDPVGKKSANRWKTGGPLAFHSGTICPVCEGRGGYAATEAYEAIRLKIDWEARNFTHPAGKALKVRQKYSVCQTKGYMQDYAKVVKCDHLVVQVPIENIVQAKFYLVGMPISPGNIIQDRYFEAFWELRE